MNGAVRELEKRLIRVTDVADRLATLIQLSIRHAEALRNREGLRAAREALELARAHDDRRAAARALLAASRCELQRGDLPAAVCTALESLEHQDVDEADGRSEAMATISRALLTAGALALAESFAESAVFEATRGADPICEARARLLHGRVLQQRGQFRPARRELRLAARHHRDLHERDALRAALVALADNYRREGVGHLRTAHIRAAHRCWSHAQRLYAMVLDAPQPADDEAAARAGLSECLCRLGRAAHARAELARALEAALRSGPADAVARCYLWESHTLKALGDLAGAERACRYARIAAEQAAHDELTAASLEALAAIHEATGRLDSATDIARRARLLSQERETQLAAVRDDLAALLYRAGAGRPQRLRCAA